SQTPSANCSSSPRADSRARLVLPLPPGPVRVTRRPSDPRARSRTTARSWSRPISRMRGAGRLVGTAAWTWCMGLAAPRPTAGGHPTIDGLGGPAGAGSRRRDGWPQVEGAGQARERGWDFRVRNENAPQTDRGAAREDLLRLLSTIRICYTKVAAV